jgi:hypothetical protein
LSTNSVQILGQRKFSEWNKDTLESETSIDTITDTRRINISSVGIQNYHCQLRGNIRRNEQTAARESPVSCINR